MNDRNNIDFDKQKQFFHVILFCTILVHCDEGVNLIWFEVDFSKKKKKFY